MLRSSTKVEMGSKPPFAALCTNGRFGASGTHCDQPLNLFVKSDTSYSVEGSSIRKGVQHRSVFPVTNNYARYPLVGD